MSVKGSLSTSVLCGRLLLFSYGTLVRIIASDGRQPTSYRAIDFIASNHTLVCL